MVQVIDAMEMIDSREDAFDWMVDHQIGKRNLSPQAISYLRGKQYRNAKKRVGVQPGTVNNAEGGNQFVKVDKGATFASLSKPKTSETIAEKHHVGERTIHNDAKFSEAVDAVADMAERLRINAQDDYKFILQWREQVKDYAFELSKFNHG